MGLWAPTLKFIVLFDEELKGGSLRRISSGSNVSNCKGVVTCWTPKHCLLARGGMLPKGHSQPSQALLELKGFHIL